MKDLYLKLPHVKLISALQLLLISLVFSGLATFLKPHAHFAKNESNFEENIPRVINDWMEIQQSAPQVSMVSDEKSLINQLYDDTLMRTYVNKDGQQVMVALAYAKEQRQDVKIHQPDICYPAQGYQMLKSKEKVFSNLSKNAQIIGKQQLYYGQSHLEAVSYWIRVGDRTMTSGLQMRSKIIEDGLLKGRLDDGILVRVSSAISDEEKASEAYALQERFIKEFVLAVEQKSPGLLVP
ncbi:MULTISPECIES: exosortase C-terminal domain/associated protein EpsI [unclassified Methylophilus]|uniref:exosortase C-terminal domain/associated protein EpsI n=1 Tax=unclassified Methylophilus TaxID=2630143 RepID=UPI00035C277A|nr:MULTISPECIES: exosortase C-terminal domain/associated protein EpsI [unclassified Methylophilus]